MDSLLTHTLSIDNHPICALKEEFRLQYVMALGELRNYLSCHDRRASIGVEVWARSIVKNPPPAFYQSTIDYQNIKSITTIKRDGLHFFNMRRLFFFDCLYLTSILNPKLLTSILYFLREHSKGIFSKQVLDGIYYNWENPFPPKIPTELVIHRNKNVFFNKKPLKKILVVATMSSGKSTLINAIMGHRVTEVKTTACTRKLCYLFNKPVQDGIIVKREDGAYFYSDNIETKNKGEFIEAGLHFNSILSDKRICLIDTPGTNYSGDKSHGEITRKAIDSNDYDGIIFVVNGLQFNTEDESKLLKYTLRHTRKPIIFVLNQLDYFNPEDDSIQDTIDNLAKIIGDKHEIIPMSAYYALLLKLNDIKLSQVELIQKNRIKQLFQLDYFNMARYCKIPSNHQDKMKELSKTGILNLEEAISKI